jgi:chromosome segregation ATPase
MSDDMKRELNGLRAEMNKGMSDVRHEMGGLRQEMGELRSELRHGMDDIRSMFRRTMIHVANMTGDIADMKRDVATKDDISRITGSIAGLSGKVDDMRLDWARSHDRLNEHEMRLDHLEPRRS